MGFILTELEVRGFRNHHGFYLSCPPGNIVIAGPNAAGKSSLLEAVQLLSMLESFRTSSWAELVQNGSQSCLLRGEFADGERALSVQMGVSLPQGRREYLFNGKRRRLSDMAQAVPVVVFTPDDLNLVKGPAEQRRSCLDSLGKRLSRQYAQIHGDYAKTMRQRNAVLRERQKSRSFEAPPSQLELSWEERLAELGSLLTVHRSRLYRRLMDSAASHYAALSGGETLSSTYLPSYQAGGTAAAEDGDEPLEKDDVRQGILAAIEARRIEEYARGSSLVGPHKDEISFYVDGREARSFVSQGQQRSVALSVKIAELETLRQVSGGEAILLLDDVLSELDEGRRSRLLELSQEVAQSFITTTDPKSVPSSYLSQSLLVELPASHSPGGSEPSEAGGGL